MLENLLLLFDNPIGLLNLIVDGIMIGAVFALIAYGMALIWGVMNIINLSQGEFVIFGGFIAYYTSNQWTLPIGPAGNAWYTIEWSGISPLWALIIAPMVLFAVGRLFYALVIFRIIERDMFTSILATFGISILLSQAMNGVFSAEDIIAQHDFDSWVVISSSSGDLVVEQVRLIALIFALIVGALLAVYLKRTRSGQAIRAVAQNARAARIMGIDADRVYARTYALNAAICGAAGVLVAMILTIHAFAGLIYTVRSFMLVIIAGLGNVTGVIVAGLGLGAAEKLAEFILGTSFQVAFVTGLLIAVLLVRAMRLRRERKALS
ncbi:MAG: branched-chain amino acid ABC transporter permease [Proteobacteria bacterium]|nr:branched-chain amino acid ABC transporter permease [Pseudomonadota bacterium]